MCGVAGIVDLRREGRVDARVLREMTDRLVHRGPDAGGYFVEPDVGLGARRLSIIDLEGGDQPMENEDRSVVLVCNGEIFNYRELAARLERRGHRFRTRCDIEVLVHLYEDLGAAMVEELDGQFAFALYDRARRRLLLARDAFGVNPLYWTESDGLFLFGSEVKAILAHPAVERRVDLTGLDQVLTFPGLVSPRTMFDGVRSLAPGHLLEVVDGRVEEREYWDLRYPTAAEAEYPLTEDEYVESFRELFFAAVAKRLQADVPVGFYLSGGLDSSLVGAAVGIVGNGQRRHSFSIDFEEASASEGSSQSLMLERLDSLHREVRFGPHQTADRLGCMIYHAECPVRETYNVCTLALSRAARDSGVKVVLTGEGADELFAGYIGYRFDAQRPARSGGFSLEEHLEEEVRERLWGDPEFLYEKEYYAHGETKAALYSPALREEQESFDCLRESPIDKERIRGVHPVHRRSYVDFKLRLADHLLGDHGDRMALANSVEGRHPFLDREVVDLATRMPPDLKLHGLREKHVVREAASGLLPERIVQREKFGWYSAGSPELLQQRIEWVEDLLSYERIRRQGYFDPDVVERLKTSYRRDGFRLNLPFEDDLLVTVLTFGLFLDRFEMPDLA